MDKEKLLGALEKLKDVIEEFDDDCEIAKSLQEDYNAFFTWAIGSNEPTCAKDQMIKKWAKKHPSLPVPRIFQTEVNLGAALSTACLFMDAYPLYLESLED